MSSGLPPVRPRGEGHGWVGVAAVGAMCVIAALLPWVQAPVGFGYLRISGIEWPQGIGVLLVGVVLLITASSAARRPDRAFNVAWHGGIAAALAVVTVASWLQVDRVLETPRGDVGVHPGTHGAGLRLTGVAAGVLAGVAVYVWRMRTSAAHQPGPER